MANMTKIDRADFDRRLALLGHYERIALQQCIAYGMESKSAWLAAQRQKEASAMAELTENEVAYAKECLVMGGNIEDSIHAAKHACKAQEPAKEEEPMEPRQIENVQALLSVKACETFLWNGQIYCALEDATKHGVCGVYIRSNLFNGARWICGDVLEVFTQEPAKEAEPQTRKEQIQTRLEQIAQDAFAMDQSALWSEVDALESELSDLESALHPDFDLPEEPRMACVYLANFGTQSDKEAICATINSLTPYRAYVNENGVPVIPCGISETGDLFAYLSRFPQTNWIEYSVQFNF